MITRINRIRLEFKVSGNSGRISRAQSINRIRLEFKGNSRNLEIYKGFQVLIESDWNLKVIETEEPPVVVAVLIESDWNLKCVHRLRNLFSDSCINRIRLEFKVDTPFTLPHWLCVLIESDWNSKDESF